MKKRMISLFLAFVMITSLMPVAFAAEVENNGVMPSSAPGTKAVASETVWVFNDPISVEIEEAALSDLQMLALTSDLTLKNKEYLGNYYYEDEPFLADVIQGPLSTGPKLELKEEFSGGFSGEFGVKESMINASFGVNISKKETKTRTVVFDPIPANRFLKYSCYYNYATYQFDVYDGDVYKGVSKYWLPVGIVVLHELV